MMSTKLLIFFSCLSLIKVVYGYRYDCDHPHPENDQFNDEKWKRDHSHVPPSDDRQFKQTPYGFAHRPFEPTFVPHKIPYVPTEPPNIFFGPPKVAHHPPHFGPPHFRPPPFNPPNFPSPSYPPPPFFHHQPHFPPQPTSPPPIFYPGLPERSPVKPVVPPSDVTLVPPRESTPLSTPETITYVPSTDNPTVDQNGGSGFSNTNQNGGGFMNPANTDTNIGQGIGADPFGNPSNSNNGGQTTEIFSNAGPSIFDGAGSTTGNNEGIATERDVNSRGLSESEIGDIINPRVKVDDSLRNKFRTSQSRRPAR